MNEKTLFRLFLICFLQVFTQNYLFSQDVVYERNISNSVLSVNRFRIQTGIFQIREFHPSMFQIQTFPIVNLHYRISMAKLDSTGDLRSIVGEFEVGTNYLVLPYVKFGPEVRINRNFYADVHVGLATFASFIGLGATPFYGGEIGYAMKLFRKTTIEIEGGVNLTKVYVPYISVGIGFY